MLINLSEVKGYLRIDGSEEDALIQQLLDGAVSFLETKLNRPILDPNMTVDNTWEVPESIRIAAYMLISHWYENRLPVGQTTKEMDFTINAIVGPHRFWNV